MTPVSQAVSKRNGAIDVYKFLLMLLIVAYHFFGAGTKYFPRGHVAVDFFVMISGTFFFTALKKIEDNGDRGYFAYLRKRYFRFFWPTLVVFILVVLINRILIHVFIDGQALSLRDWIVWTANDLPEILLIKMAGWGEPAKRIVYLNGPVWTLSAMLITEFLITSIISYRKDLFYKVICPMGVIVGSGVFGQAGTTFYGDWVGLCTGGLLRVFVVTCISYYAYRLALYLKQYQLSSAGSALFSFLEAFCVIVFFLITIGPKSGGRYVYYWTSLVLAFFATAIAMSDKGLSSNLLKGNRLTNYLGRLSFALYLVHGSIVTLYTAYFVTGEMMYQHFLSFVIIVSVLTVSFEFINRHLAIWLKDTASSLRRKLIIEKE